VPATSARVRDRLTSGMRQVDGLPMLIVSGIAALVMTGGALVLRRHHEDEDDVAFHTIALIRKVLIRLGPAVAAEVVTIGHVRAATASRRSRK